MKDIIEKIDHILVNEGKWRPPEGFFNQNAKKIALTLASVSKNSKEATDILDKYITNNKLSRKEMKKFDEVREKLKTLTY
jgi:F0F1-type ATP synthase membrane subunit b/b'